MLPAPRPKILNRVQVARRMDRSLNFFDRKRAELETKHGFPKPLPGWGLRWDERAVEAWIDQQLPAYARAAAPDPEAVRTAEAEARLRAAS